MSPRVQQLAASPLSHSRSKSSSPWSRITPLSSEQLRCDPNSHPCIKSSPALERSVGTTRPASTASPAATQSSADLSPHLARTLPNQTAQEFQLCCSQACCQN